MADQKQHFEARTGARASSMQTQTVAFVLGIPERLFNAHSLCIQGHDGFTTQM